MDASLYAGRVMHQRWQPKAYRFVYRVFSLLLDIDRLDVLAGRLRLFSVGRFNLLSFYPGDHGPRDGSSLRAWAEQLLAARGIRLGGGRIRLLCFPRVLGHGFNPLSVWYCEHADGELRAIICEVRNTFGEKHHYILDNGGRSLDLAQTWEAQKRLHVSPFLPLELDYRFQLTVPGEQLRVLIDEYAGTQRILAATLLLRRRPLNDAALLGQCLAIPFLTLKVIAMIHWQAVKLWLRGFRFHPKPPAPDHEASHTWIRK